MSRIDRIRHTVSARRAARRAEARADEAREAADVHLPVPVAPVEGPRTFRETRPRGMAELVAQVLGQDGQRRGLRAGASIHDIARAAYNKVEWSGRYDRRARKGRRAATDI